MSADLDLHQRDVVAVGHCRSCKSTALEPSCGYMTQRELERLCEAYMFNQLWGMAALKRQTRALLSHCCEAMITPACQTVPETWHETRARRWYSCAVHASTVARAADRTDGRKESLLERRQRLGIATRWELRQLQKEHRCLWCGDEASGAARVPHGLVFFCFEHPEQVRARAAEQLEEHRLDQLEMARARGKL